MMQPGYSDQQPLIRAITSQPSPVVGRAQLGAGTLLG